MRVLPTISAICLSGCAVENESKLLRLGEARYSVPASHIRAINTKPHNFVRIRAPGNSFDLVYDSRSARRTDAHGWPVIFSINDGAAPDVDRYNRDSLQIVCRRAVNPQGGCGFVLVDRGVAWSVLMPIAQLDSAGRIEQAARSALEGYGATAVEAE